MHPILALAVVGGVAYAVKRYIDTRRDGVGADSTASHTSTPDEGASSWTAADRSASAPRATPFAE
jgi:hypothetical protein